MFIGGKWTDSDSAEIMDVIDPGYGQRIARVSAGGASDIGRAVDAAKDAFRKSDWAKMPVNDRAVFIHRLADLVDKNRRILAQIESLDVGKPFSNSFNYDIPKVSESLRYYADLAVHTRRREPIAVSGYDVHTYRQPYGACAFIFPWNFPLQLLGIGIAPALATGNTVVIKPAEDTPLSSLYFGKLVQQAGVPDGVINIVPGLGRTAGAALAQHRGIKRMSFTGSPETGRLVAESCGRNLVPTKLELGGKGAAVVFDDVDLATAAKGLSNAITLNAGQVCCTATRWLIQDKILDRFVDQAVTNLQSVKIGHGLESGTEMGPLVSVKQRERVLGYLKKGADEGAVNLLKGGATNVPGHEGGFYVTPVLLTGSSDNVCAKEEIFGPVAYVMPFHDEDEAIEMVNSSDYGLANSVWTKDIDKANRVSESFVVGINYINTHNDIPMGVPFSGWNRSGFGGGVLGPDTLLDYWRPQSVTRLLA
jgi:acyl-CoA reductase-like NAD-dependent aldehyde dehydrogenase